MFDHVRLGQDNQHIVTFVIDLAWQKCPPAHVLLCSQDVTLELQRKREGMMYEIASSLIQIARASDLPKRRIRITPQL
jgi:hypothetical protein